MNSDLGHKALQRLPLIGLCVYMALFPLPIPPFISIVPLLAAGISLAIRPLAQTAALDVPFWNLKSILLAIAAAAYLMSIFFSQNPWKSLQSASFWLPGLVTLAVTFQLSITHHGRTAIADGATACVTVMSALFLVAVLSSDSASSVVLDNVGSTSLVVPNDLTIAVILLPFLLYSLSTSISPIRRLANLLAIALSILAIALSSSRLCLVAIFALTALYAKDKRSVWILLPHVVIALALTFSALDIAFNTGFIGKLASIANQEGRLAVWQASVLLWDQHPWLGFGPAGFESIYRAAIQQQLILDSLTLDSRMVTWSHSLVLEALAERGILGLTTFFLVISHVLQSFISSAQPSNSTFYRAVLFSFVLFCLVGFLELTLQRIWVVIVLCLYLGIYLAEPSNSEA